MPRLLPRPEQLWYQGHWLGGVLAPLGWLYCAAALLRRRAYTAGWQRSSAAGAPVIVVGNLSVGGTGKTPLVLWLAGRLRARGRRPGIVLRGYGAEAGRAPRRVAGAPPDPALFGDEAVLLAERSGCPVTVGHDRVAAARLLHERCGCELIISDDGLQHYRLRRDLEILVIDGVRGLGNGRCLPAGPLREPPARARSVDLVVRNGGRGAAGERMRLEPGAAVNLAAPGRRQALHAFAGQRVLAVAGIGHPERFFALLRAHGLDIDTRAYPDHHRFSAAEVGGWRAQAVLMTEKDMVKCRTFARPELWYVPVDAVPEPTLAAALEAAFDRLDARRAAAPEESG